VTARKRRAVVDNCLSANPGSRPIDASKTSNVLPEDADQDLVAGRGVPRSQPKDTVRIDIERDLDHRAWLSATRADCP
jgi:hypothetical protein